MVSAAGEIRSLRRTIEMQAAQLEVVEVFRVALLGRREGQPCSPCVAWALEEAAKQMEAEDAKERVGVNVSRTMAGRRVDRFPRNGPKDDRCPSCGCPCLRPPEAICRDEDNKDGAIRFCGPCGVTFCTNDLWEIQMDFVRANERARASDSSTSNAVPKTDMPASEDQPGEVAP